jgi:two-component system cell cycle response regulator PopA
LRIVIRAKDNKAALAVQTRLAAAGIEAAVLSGAQRMAPDGEDIAIVFSAEQYSAVSPSALLTLTGCTHAKPPPASLCVAGEMGGALALDAPAKLLSAQIDAWIRVAIAEEERTRRQATANACGVNCPGALETRKLKVLYIGAPSTTFLALEQALAEQGGLVAAAFSSFAGFDHLHDEPFDAVVLNGARDPQIALSLCSALRRNASLYHLPTLVVTAPGDTATAASALQRGAAAVTETNAPCAPSLGWMFEAIRRERRRRAAEHQIRGLRDLMGEPRTGLWRRETFAAHLSRLAADHHASGRPLSLAALHVLPAHGARTPEPEVWRRGFNEIASLAARLMRDADSGAVVQGDYIAVALPASPLSAARRTAERIAAVAECTAFASGDNGAPPLVFEQSAVELQPGESGAAMLARALRALDVESITA